MDKKMNKWISEKIKSKKWKITDIKEIAWPLRNFYTSQYLNKCLVCSMLFCLFLRFAKYKTFPSALSP